jgi:hypothetical protein
MKAINESKTIFFRGRLLSLLLTILILFPSAADAQDRRARWRRPAPEPDPIRYIHTSYNGQGIDIEIHFEKGKTFNHPLMAIWLEDMDGNYIQTLYVAESIAKGVYRHGDASSGRWKPGPIRRPAALPYWGHQRGIKASDGFYLPEDNNPMPDALTGPTPKGDFVVKTRTPSGQLRKFRVLFEINQSWDWNEFWTNNKFPGDREYMTSAQPALVYEAVIDLDSNIHEFPMKPIGHSHWSGRNGTLYEDLRTITTALDISKSIKVVIH